MEVTGGAEVGVGGAGVGTGGAGVGAGGAGVGAGVGAGGAGVEAGGAGVEVGGAGVGAGVGSAVGADVAGPLVGLGFGLCSKRRVAACPCPEASVPEAPTLGSSQRSPPCARPPADAVLKAEAASNVSSSCANFTNGRAFLDPDSTIAVRGGACQCLPAVQQSNV